MRGRIRNWTDFQHYKDRAPPWIKLHRKLLTNYDFARLPLASKALAPLLWLVAAESEDGSFDASPGYLAFRTTLSEGDVVSGLKPLIDAGFIDVDSAALAACLQDATPEREVETETETETEEKQSASPDGDAPPRKAIPYNGIVAAYNALMTNLPKVRDISADRKTAMRKAWQGSADRQSIEFWQAYFEECAEDPFRNGTGPYKPPHENWRPDFDFLIQSKQVTKVYEAALHRMENHS